MAAPIVTALYASLNGILNIVLAERVSAARRSGKVSIGTPDGAKELLLAARIHGNNAEFVPLALVLMLIAELCGGGSTPLHVWGGLLFVARLMHVIGMRRPAPNVFRVLGTGITWIGIVAVCGWLLYLRRGH